MSEQRSGTIEISVAGVGGIDETTVHLREGVNLLAGRNATNRTSFLQAVTAAVGSEDVSLKGNRETGHVELSLDGETYTRTLERAGNTVQFSGDPYLSEPMEADLFAFLLESNEVRQTVTSEGDLREVIMRPVDTAEIEQQIRQLQRERRDIDEEIETLQRERDQLPALEERRTELTEELEATRTALEDARTELDTAGTDVEDRKAEKAELDETLVDLNEARSDLDDVEYRLETEREALEAAAAELEEARADQSTDLESAEARLAALDDEIDRLREQKRARDTRVSKLHRIVQFDEQMLDGDSVLGELLEDEGNVTDELLGDSETTCWTCGSTVETGDIEGMLDQLRELSHEQREQRNEIEAEIDERTAEREELESTIEKQRDRSERIAELEAVVERRQETVANLESERAELEARISDLEATADDLEPAAESEVLEAHKTVNEKEVTIQRLEQDLADVRAEIEELEAASETIDQLEQQRAQIDEQLTELRTRIERLESEAVEAFNEHTTTLVDLLEYENLARVWIERQTRASENSTFRLHVVRTAEDGTTYEDKLAHLSESEREIVGLVFALAGYLVHEVYETQPFLLLDSLEAIDAGRIALLIEYLADYAPMIVAALLHEDTEYLDESYPRVQDI